MDKKIHKELLASYSMEEEDRDYAIDKTWDRVFKDYFSFLWPFVKGRVYDRMLAEDIIQVTLHQLHLHLIKIKGEKKFIYMIEPWLFKVALFRIIDHSRSSSRDFEIKEPTIVNDPLEYLPSSGKTPDENLVLSEDFNRLDKGIGQLDEKKKKLIEGHFEKSSCEEISRETNIPVNQVPVYKKRAIETLQKILMNGAI